MLDRALRPHEKLVSQDIQVKHTANTEREKCAKYKYAGTSAGVAVHDIDCSMHGFSALDRSRCAKLQISRDVPSYNDQFYNFQQNNP